MTDNISQPEIQEMRRDFYTIRVTMLDLMHHMDDMRKAFTRTHDKLDQVVENLLRISEKIEMGLRPIIHCPKDGPDGSRGV